MARNRGVMTVRKVTMWDAPFTLENMNGRPVFTRAYTKQDAGWHTKLATCADCSEPTTKLIYELDASVWGHCGVCSIG